MADTGKDLNVLGAIDNNFLMEVFIAAYKKGEAAKSWLYLGDGIEQIDQKTDDTKSSKSYMNGGGQTRTTVTGSTISYDVSGDRSIGNPAQDLIAKLKGGTGVGRYSNLRVNQYTMNDDGSLTLIESEEGVATWSDITDRGGKATDPKTFKATATYNSKPQYIEQGNAKLTQVLTDTPSVNAEILSTTATASTGTPS